MASKKKMGAKKVAKKVAKKAAKKGASRRRAYGGYGGGMAPAVEPSLYQCPRGHVVDENPCPVHHIPTEPY